MRIVKDIEQGSIEWNQLRLGKVTASRIKDVMTNGRGSAISKTSESYMYELLADLLTGEPQPFFENDAMRWGTETEPKARLMYELKTGIEVEQVAFIEHSDFIGVSPDGLIGNTGLIEIKCPKTTTQLKRSQQENYHTDYKYQIQMQLWVSERDWCDFLSFDPRLQGKAKYLCERVYRDEKIIADMQDKTEVFVDKLKSLFESLKD